ncbi:hypothetical protein NDU88_001291 [Pleurodeles waltl]|uniref:Uncharacterized protein n=1 Tax=Pleurodeles waltl TaxID=8319 RepID=A0AAV7Q6F4_PLEWA|nr:hypothetical protein NDU88_001291 [Pleurodeles waltl]
MVAADQQLERPAGLRVPVGVRAPPGHRVEERAQPRAVRLTSREVAVCESGSSDTNLGFIPAIPDSQGAMSGLDIDEEPLDYEEEDPVHGVQAIAVQKSKMSRRVVQCDHFSLRPQDLTGYFLRGCVGDPDGGCSVWIVGHSFVRWAEKQASSRHFRNQLGLDGAKIRISWVDKLLRFVRFSPDASSASARVVPVTLDGCDTFLPDNTWSAKKQFALHQQQ